MTLDETVLLTVCTCITTFFAFFGIFSILFQVKSILIFKEFFIGENNVEVRDKEDFFVKTI